MEMGGTLGENAPLKYKVRVGAYAYAIEINDDHSVVIDGQQYQVDFRAVSGQDLYSILIGGHSHAAYVEQDNSEWMVLHQGNLHTVHVEDERSQLLKKWSTDATVSPTGEFNLTAPMPGLVVSVPVSEGQRVSRGDVLVILESMKMQNELKASHDSLVKRVNVKVDDSVEQKQIMVILE